MSIYTFLILLPFTHSFPSTNPLPKILTNPRDCPLNACEVVKIFAEHLFTSKNNKNHQFTHITDISVSDDYPNVKEWERNSLSVTELETRLLEVERRLRSVEQPIWKIISESEDAWDKCTEGICRCHATIKSLSCWRADMLHLPPLQVIPTNILKM